MKKYTLISLLAVIIVFALTSCNVSGPPFTEKVSPEALSKASEVFTDYKNAALPTGWEFGIVMQKSWEEIIGIKGDPYNNVRLFLLLPDGEIRILKPFLGSEEAYTVENIGVGDLMGFRMRETSKSQNSHLQYFKRGEIQIIKKSVLDR